MRDGAPWAREHDRGCSSVSAVVSSRGVRATVSSTGYRSTSTVPGSSPYSGTRAATWRANASNAARISSWSSGENSSMIGGLLCGPGGDRGHGTPRGSVRTITPLDPTVRRLGYAADRGAGPSRALRPEAGRCRSRNAMGQRRRRAQARCTQTHRLLDKEVCQKQTR